MYKYCDMLFNTYTIYIDKRKPIDETNDDPPVKKRKINENKSKITKRNCTHRGKRYSKSSKMLSKMLVELGYDNSKKAKYKCDQCGHVK